MGPRRTVTTTDPDTNKRCEPYIFSVLSEGMYDYSPSVYFPSFSGFQVGYSEQFGFGMFAPMLIERGS